MKRPLVLVIAPLLILACQDYGQLTGPADDENLPAFSIEDAAHGGLAGFYFLPPLVPATGHGGVFDAQLSPVVRICALSGGACNGQDIAVFTTGGGGPSAVKVDLAGQAYGAVWQTVSAGLSTATDYRLRVYVGDRLLGYADLDVVPKQQDLVGVPAGKVGIVNKRPVPFKFRIETGIVGEVVVTPAGSSVAVGETRQFTATLYDLHEVEMSGPEITWSTGDPAVATVSSNGLALGIGAGSTEITATVQQTSGSGALTVTGGSVLPQIAFVSDRIGPTKIYLMNADGTGEVRLTEEPFGFESGPSWSPDGAQIVYVTSKDLQPEIYVINSDGSGGGTRLTFSGGTASPVWSPDGAQIAFQKSVGSGTDTEIFTMSASGGLATDISNSVWNDRHPSWSPAGDAIAFASARDGVGTYDIWVMQPNGGGQTNLTHNTIEDDFPAWSPDGTRIAFASYRDGNWEIYVMSANGSSPARLTNDPAVDLQPAWSPDGSKLLFVRGSGIESELYVMNADGSGQTRLTNNSYMETQPAWRW